jgi:hypothetical protein
VVTVDLCQADLLWNGQVRTVDVEALDGQPLLGMRLLAGHELRMQVVAGGTVTIEALP